MSRTIDELCVQLHKTATEHGFWDDSEKLIAKGVPASLIITEKLALIVTEIGEAIESLRDGTCLDQDEHIPDFRHFEVELADIVIRICDLYHWLEKDSACYSPLGAVIDAKDAFNKSRPYKHGKAF